MKGDITLFDAGSVKIYTNGQGDYDVQIRNGNSNLVLNTPKQGCWTTKDVDDAKAIKQLYRDAVFVRRMVMGDLELLDQNESIVEDSICIPGSFPSLTCLQKAKLDDIIRGEE